MKAMGKTRVLTRAEEGQLFAILNRPRAWGLAPLRPATAAAATAAFAEHGLSEVVLRRAEERAAAAAELLMRFNKRLVLSLAKRMGAGSDVALEDLLAEGELGLATAMLKFDLSRGFKFSTYSTWHVKAKIQRCMQSHSLMRVPQSVAEAIPRVLRAREELRRVRSDDDARVSVRDVAEVLGMEPTKVERALRACVQPASLEAPATIGAGARGEVGDESLLETVPDADAGGEMEAVHRDVLVRECLNGVLHTLQPRERNIIRLRYGLNVERRVVSLHEIADAYGLSRERIRQIEDQAVRKLMAPWRRQALAERTSVLF